ncbi:hypothetical protein JTB14_037713 [Gonioctena quinquepunctata]|nr:hypothetical protein JTB14_037713 [Gonioctena quinquepunctata]
MTDLATLKFTRKLVKSNLTRVKTHCSKINFDSIEQNTCNELKFRWYEEYISELQVRVKLKNNAQKYLKILVKEETTSPLQWSLVKTVQLHPGNDGIARVAFEIVEVPQ